MIENVQVSFQLKSSTWGDATNMEKLVNEIEKDHLCVWQFFWEGYAITSHKRFRNVRSSYKIYGEPPSIYVSEVAVSRCSEAFKI